MRTISLRIDNELEQKLKFLMTLKQIQDRSSYLRLLLERAMTQDMIEFALKEFKNRRVSLWKASSIAGVSLREFMDIAKSHSISTIDETTIREDVKWVRNYEL